MKLKPNLERVNKYIIDTYYTLHIPQYDLLLNVEKFFGCLYYQPRSDWDRLRFRYLVVAKGPKAVFGTVGLYNVGREFDKFTVITYSTMVEMLRKEKSKRAKAYEYKEELL